MGVDARMATDEDARTQEIAIARELVRAEFLEVAWESAACGLYVRPTPATLQRLAGWPVDGAQEVLSGLVEALSAEIDRTPDAARRSILVQVRDGLVGAARDIALAYIEKKIGAA